VSDTFTYTAVSRVSPKAGLISGGQSVTITGFGFTFATGGVSFGGTAATDVVIVSNTTITAVTPAHNSGAVDVVVEGVGTGSGLYTYELVGSTLLPRVPVSTDNKLDVVGAPRWLMVVKQRLEQPVTVGTEQVTGGPFQVDQIPELPWTKIDKTGSSLADLTTRSASDLTSGILRQSLGGTGRANAYSFAPGSFTVQDGTFALILSSLQLTNSIDVLTVLGSGSVGIL